MQANASKHSALSYGHALKQEEQLRAADSHRVGFTRGGGKPAQLESSRTLRKASAAGIIKSVMRFRQFLLRGLHQVQGEWNRVTMAWNIKRMFVLQARTNEPQAQPA